MGRRGGTLLSLFALALLLALPASAAAKSKPITGKLSKRGYTVIALDSQGQATSVVAKPKFKLRPRANKVTLQLRAPNGTYAGPVVFVGDKGGKARKSKKRKKMSKRAIVGLKKLGPGVNLGKVKVKAGFAVAKGVAKTSLDTKRTATAKKGVPIGAGNFGRVAVAKLNGPSADRDLDGVPTPLDIDDDGDLVLDDVDPNPTGTGIARAAQAPGGPGLPVIFTQLFQYGNSGYTPIAPSTQPVNASAPGLRDADIEAALRSIGKVVVSVGLASPELDCGGDPIAVPPRPGLSYCSAGGTGRKLGTDNPFVLYPDAPPFPACCDPDGDGFGSLDDEAGGGSGGRLLHGASSDQIRGGDQFLMRSDVPAGVQEMTGTLATTYHTPPALASYTDGLNDAGQGETHAVTYPIVPGSALPVRDGPDADSDVEVKLTFWRPQRRALPESDPAGSKWMDMGGLMYYVGAGDLLCPGSTYSDWDPVLAPSQQVSHFAPTREPIFVFIDKQEKDLPANRDNTFSFTLNMTQCAAAGGHGFDPGGGFGLPFNAFPLPGANPYFGTNGAGSGYLFRNQP